MSSQVRSMWILGLVIAVISSLGVFLLAPYTNSIQFPEDQGFNWYYWKLPNPDFMSRATSWGFYALHQIFIWGCIAWALRNREKLTNWKTLHPLNYIMLGGTAVFIFLHYIQTAIWFDGLGQDIPVILSQGSVIVVLVIILIMEAPRRGLFFGEGKSWFTKLRPFLFRYHGYYISWAVVFTFWYHPMYPTWGHVTGFFYMFLIFLQLSMIYTNLHVNKYWTFIIETAVILHAIVMAVVNGNGMWAMFGFGFLSMLLITQMHGIGLSKAQKWGVTIASFVALIIAYYFRGYEHISEVIRIPLLEYPGALAIGALLLLLLRNSSKPTSG